MTLDVSDRDMGASSYEDGGQDDDRPRHRGGRKVRLRPRRQRSLGKGPRLAVEQNIADIIRALQPIRNPAHLGYVGVETIDKLIVYHLTAVKKFPYVMGNGQTGTYETFDVWVEEDGTPVLASGQYLRRILWPTASRSAARVSSASRSSAGRSAFAALQGLRNQLAPIPAGRPSADLGQDESDGTPVRLLASLARRAGGRARSRRRPGSTQPRATDGGIGEPAGLDRRRQPLSQWDVHDPEVVVVVHRGGRPIRAQHRRPEDRPQHQRPASLLQLDALRRTATTSPLSLGRGPGRLGRGPSSFRRRPLPARVEPDLRYGVCDRRSRGCA